MSNAATNMDRSMHASTRAPPHTHKHMDARTHEHTSARTHSLSQDACPPPKKRGWLSGGSSRGGGGCCCGGDMHEEVVIIEKIQPERYAKDGSGSMPKSMSHTKTVGKKKAGG